MFFFFKQKTAYEIKECDWSSDVCSSDLELFTVPRAHRPTRRSPGRHPGETGREDQGREESPVVKEAIDTGRKTSEGEKGTVQSVPFSISVEKVFSPA